MSKKNNATRLLVDHLKPGMVLGADVVGLYGDTVAKTSTALTDPVIRRIKLCGVKAAYILISSLKEEQTQVIFEDIEEKQTLMVENFQTIFTDNVVNETEIIGMVNDAIAVARGSGGVTKYLDLLHQKTEYTYTHCMSVSMLARLFAEWTRQNEDEVYDITLAGSLHDIGKLEVGLDLINKPDKLSDEEYVRVKEHVMKGSVLLHSCDIPKKVLLTVLEHHERLDGKGYPLGKKGNEISKLGNMLSIVDVYDALVSKRSYRDALCPFIALEIMERDRFSAFDFHLFDEFMLNVVYAYINAKVQLSNTEMAEIVSINPKSPLKPVVHTEHGEFIDLNAVQELKIVKLWF